MIYGEKHCVKGVAAVSLGTTLMIARLALVTFCQPEESIACAPVLAKVP